MNILEPKSKYDAKATDFFLSMMSDKFAGKQDCRRKAYTLRITDESPQRVIVEPAVYLYRSVHEKEPTDLLPLVEYLLEKYMDDTLTYFCDDDGAIVIKPEIFVPGTYEFQLSTNKRRRRWVKTA